MAITRASSIAACALALLWSAVALGAAKGGTAKARLSDAKAAAVQWQKDAVLVSVTALQAADDGTAPLDLAGWVYTFHSPGTKRFVAKMTGPPTAKPEKPASTGSGVVAGLDPAQCAGFSPADAAAILGVKAAGVARKAEQVRADLWRCSFTTPGGPRVVFSIEVAKSAADAAAGMEKYRKSLKDDYSDLMGLGDEGVWTGVDRTVTYRKKNVTIRVQQPPEKIPQLKVIKVLLDRI